ncbi:hypothetical protein V5F77_16040 [Xanthobacter sp. DSM 24535]|uniref:hypothetical protein n=1 Tax=Roseixanthobacter psychrophilus TaxID=3119917 RepID=UPI0037282625
MAELAGRGRGITGRLLVAAGCLSAGLLVVDAAFAQTPGNFSFGAPPSAQANRLYSVNHQTGEVSACQFERPDSALVGITRCFPKGEGAGAQKPGTYELVSTRFAGETGIFRVNAETGEMSVCYVRDVPKSGGGAAEPMVLCTPSAK